MSVLVIEQTVIEEVKKLRNHRLGALTLEQIDQMIVGERHVLDEYLADDADSRLSECFVYRELIEGLYDHPAVLRK